MADLGLYLEGLLRYYTSKKIKNANISALLDPSSSRQHEHGTKICSHCLEIIMIIQVSGKAFESEITICLKPPPPNSVGKCGHEVRHW